MQYKYTENTAHSKWFTHFKSKHINFTFEDKAGRNISLGQPTFMPVVIWSKIKNNNRNNKTIAYLELKEQEWEGWYI